MARYQQLGLACVLALCGTSRTVDANGCPIPGFGDAAFGKSSVTFNGNGCTDSWNSTAGTYASTACSGASCNGSVGTDSSASGAITLTGNACVKGACDEGYGGTVSSISGASGCDS